MEEGDLTRALDDEPRIDGKTQAAKGLADNEHGSDLELLVIRGRGRVRRLPYKR